MHAYVRVPPLSVTEEKWAFSLGSGCERMSEQANDVDAGNKSAEPSSPLSFMMIPEACRKTFIIPVWIRFWRRLLFKLWFDRN